MRSFIARGGKAAGGLLAVGTLVAAVAVPASAAGSAHPRPPFRDAAVAGSCHLGNGVKHVINITFDNVHFFRDNPNVPSDLEQMPTLLHFLESNGTVLSNMHTPLIAHTAEDSLAIYSGPVRRPARSAGEQHVPHVQAGRHGSRRTRRSSTGPRR